MSVTVKGFDGAAFDMRSAMSWMRLLTTIHQFILSGNYTTGGDTVDWTNGGVNSAVPAGQAFQTTGPIRCDINDNGPVGGILANGGNYILIPGASISTWKLKIFKTAGSEYGNGAYVADALTDTILVKSDWAR